MSEKLLSDPRYPIGKFSFPDSLTAETDFELIVGLKNQVIYCVTPYERNSTQ